MRPTLSPDERARLEARLCTLLEEGRLDEAATVAVRSYGPEVLSLMVAVLGDADDAREAFSDFSEDLWRGLDGFERRSSFRTWAYVLARHAMVRFAEARRQRHFRGLPLWAAAQAEAVLRTAEEVASATLPTLRSDAVDHDHVARLRETLVPADQTLLILRVDRGLPWSDVARILGDGDGSPASLGRIEARLRKRFERLIADLRTRTHLDGTVE